MTGRETYNFYLTFGQKSPARNGYIHIEATSYECATAMAKGMYGDDWAMLYTEQEFDSSHFPAGKLGRIG